MYRVHEWNGTSFVYNVDTGNLAMIIKSNNKENGLKEDQVVINDSKKGQLLTNSLNKTCLNKFCPSVNLPKVTYCNDDSDDVLSESEFRRRFGKQTNKNTYVPVYDQNSFLEIFNLRRNSPDEAVQRLRIPQVDDDDDASNLSDDGLKQLSKTAVSDFDFSSALGQSILQRKRNCNTYVRDAAASVTKYDKYCLSTKRIILGDGQLRERQANYAYQVSYVPRTRANGHKYVFNKKQRIERLEVIHTGLNRRARLLKRLCKNVEVNLNRLSEEDIRIWTTPAPRSSALPGFTDSPLRGQSSIPLQPCIDGTIVIQIEDSDDEEVTVSPKPAITSGTCSLGQTFHWQNGHLTIGPALTVSPVINTAHPLFTNGLTLRNVPQPNSSLAVTNSSLLKPSVGPKRSAKLKDAYVATLRPNADKATADSDSDDSEIEFLGCVPRPRPSLPGPNLTDFILGSNAEQVPRFLVTNLCQPTFDMQKASPEKMNLTHALQMAASTNGSSPVNSMNRRVISSPGTQKVPISPYHVKTRFHPQILARNLDESLSKPACGGAMDYNSSTRLQRSATSLASNERISSDFSRLEVDLGRLFDRLNQQCAIQCSVSSCMLPEVRELAVNFQCHMCGFEEKHYYSAAKRISRHMDKYHGEVDGAVRLLVNGETTRNDPPLIVVQAVSWDVRLADYMVTGIHTIINL